MRDDTCYSPNLRPGVMLSCECNSGEELCAGSGIMVENSAGDKWLTVATQPWLSFGKRNGLPSRCNGLVVGKVESIFEDTDISLAKLRMGIRYAAQTFGSNLKPSILIGDNFTIENSFSGFCGGIFLASIWKCIPANDNRHKLPWVVISNFCLRNGGEEPLDGSCGSPVLTETGEVVGLLRFMVNSGKAYCVYAEVLMENRI